MLPDTYYTNPNLQIPIIAESYSKFAGLIAFFLYSAKFSGRRPVHVDVGSGSGNLIDVMLKTVPGPDYIGIEPSGAMVKLSRKRFADSDSVQIYQGSTSTLTDIVEEGSASVVTMHNAFHYVSPDQAVSAMSQLRAILQPGGGLILSAFRPDFDLEVLARKNIRAVYSDKFQEWLRDQVSIPPQLMSYALAIENLVTQFEGGNLGIADFFKNVAEYTSRLPKECLNALPVRLSNGLISSMPLEFQLNPLVHKYSREALTSLLIPHFSIKSIDDHYDGSQHLVVALAN